MTFLRPFASVNSQNQVTYAKGTRLIEVEPHVPSRLSSMLDGMDYVLHYHIERVRQSRLELRAPR